eukprot:3984880-Pyramimonas_sp.AAC.1
MGQACRVRLFRLLVCCLVAPGCSASLLCWLCRSGRRCGSSAGAPVGRSRTSVSSRCGALCG